VEAVRAVGRGKERAIPPLKFIALIVAVVGAWFFFSWLRRYSAVRKASAQSKKVAVKPAEDMLPCPTCAAYVPAETPARCGRDDCPYPVTPPRG
jgi:hypothetical protein